mgnify:CR=1 FL=1
MLISNTKEGRKDGSYTRLFGNKDLGALISRVHSSSISSGNELEKIIESMAETIDDLDLFLKEKTFKKGTFLITKKTIKKSILKSNQEPDFLIIRIEDNHCKIIELKDGDTFDTKKAKGEKQNLINFQNNISNKIPYTTSIYICSFNQENKDLIKAGMKNEFDSSEIMTGKEFCQLLNINYDKILERRKNDQKKNIQFFLNEINRITKK